MFKIQCDKNFIIILKRFFNKISLRAEICLFSQEKCDICILRDEFLPENFTPTCKYLLINSDDKNLIKKIQDTNSTVISCGLSTRSTATLSSISDENKVLCLQRNLTDLNGNIIPQSEIPFVLSEIFIDDISVIILIVSALLCGADMKK